VVLDGHVGLDSSSSGSSFAANGSHVTVDRLLVLEGSIDRSLSSDSGSETSGLAFVHGSSVSLGPFDVVFTSSCFFRKSLVLVFP